MNNLCDSIGYLTQIEVFTLCLRLNLIFLIKNYYFFQ